MQGTRVQEDTLITELPRLEGMGFRQLRICVSFLVRSQPTGSPHHRGFARGTWFHQPSELKCFILQNESTQASTENNSFRTTDFRAGMCNTTSGTDRPLPHASQHSVVKLNVSCSA
jgi:hypothetical protein